jgi:hypothetical protein
MTRPHLFTFSPLHLFILVSHLVEPDSQLVSLLIALIHEEVCASVLKQGDSRRSRASFVSGTVIVDPSGTEQSFRYSGIETEETK